MYCKLMLSSTLLFLTSLTLAATPPTAVRTQPLQGTVALTFDDGPSPIYTPQILSILKKYNVKATFFMLGYDAKEYSNVVKQVHAEGHAIGNHSLTHPFLTKVSEERLIKEITMPQTIINDIIGKKPVCMRYPYDDKNEHVKKVILAHGLQPIGVDFDTSDYKRHDSQHIVRLVLKYAKPGNVIVFHDGGKHPATVAALPQIIEGLQKKGIGFSQICMM